MRATTPGSSLVLYLPIYSLDTGHQAYSKARDTEIKIIILYSYDVENVVGKQVGNLKARSG